MNNLPERNTAYLRAVKPKRNTRKTLPQHDEKGRFTKKAENS